MGTKANPGRFDCYANAAPDEPMFVLLARDRLAPHLVSIWAKLRVGDVEAATVVFENLLSKHAGHYAAEPDSDKAGEALETMFAMLNWRKANRKD